MAQFVATTFRKFIRRNPVLQYPIWLFEAMVLGGFLLAMSLLPAATASRVGGALVRSIGPRLQKSEIIARNLRMAFPECSETAIAGMVRETWGNVGAVLAEYAHLSGICREGPRPQIEVEVRGRIRGLEDPDAPLVFVSGHFGNWELLAGAASRLLEAPLVAVYTPLSNPLIAAMIQRCRRNLRARLVARDESMTALLQALRQSNAVGLLVDQRIDSGENLPFFGADCPTSLVPARLALMHDCELVPARVERLGPARFRLVLYEPILPADRTLPKAERARRMTRQINACFESWIRERPGEWMCTKRRWSKNAVPSPRSDAAPANTSAAK